MNYHGETIGGGAVITGVAVLPNTGTNSILRYVTVAVIVTGAILLILQLIVIWRRKHKTRK